MTMVITISVSTDKNTMNSTTKPSEISVEDLGHSWLVTGTMNPREAKQAVKDWIAEFLQDSLSESHFHEVDSASTVVKKDWFWKPFNDNKFELASATEHGIVVADAFPGVLIK
jgi:hypothetical protein